MGSSGYDNKPALFYLKFQAVTPLDKSAYCRFVSFSSLCTRLMSETTHIDD